MKRILAILLLCQPLLLAAQTPAPPAGANWQHLQAIPPGTLVHIEADTKSRKCFFAAADDEALTCTRGHAGTGARYVFPRAQVSSVKLTRRGVSTLAGMGIGLGAGLAVGAAIGHAEDPPDPSAFLDFSGLGRAVITGFGGIIGLAAGGAIGGPTDFLRGPTVYRRP